MTSLFTAYYIESQDDEIVDIEDYVVGLWF